MNRLVLLLGLVSPILLPYLVLLHGPVRTTARDHQNAFCHANVIDLLPLPPSSRLSIATTKRPLPQRGS
jgi:hypothetical protein